MGRRNLQGGSKTKSMARKGGQDCTDNIIIPSTDEEKYAIVTAVLGNGRFAISSLENKEHIAILPGAMRGAKKRKNFVMLHSIILINDRSSWQTIKHRSHADIIHIYSEQQCQQIRLNELFDHIKNKDKRQEYTSEIQFKNDDNDQHFTSVHHHTHNDNDNDNDNTVDISLI